jgi:exopolyphosphatase/pppGpp-phosphohydrolase
VPEEVIMTRKFRAAAYRTALLVSLGSLLAVSISILATYQDFRAHADLWSQESINATIFTRAGIFVAAVVVFSGVFFGWREDRIEVTKLTLRIEDLKIKLRDVESRLVRTIVNIGQQSTAQASTPASPPQLTVPILTPSVQPEQSPESPCRGQFSIKQ